MCPQISDRKNFTPKYKKEFVRLIKKQDKKVSELVVKIGVSQTPICSWTKQYSRHAKHTFFW